MMISKTNWPHVWKAFYIINSVIDWFYIVFERMFNVQQNGSCDFLHQSLVSFCIWMAGLLLSVHVLSFWWRESWFNKCKLKICVRHLMATGHWSVVEFGLSPQDKVHFWILLQIPEKPDQVGGNGPGLSASALKRLDMESVLGLGGTHWTRTSICWEGKMDGSLAGFVCLLVSLVVFPSTLELNQNLSVSVKPGETVGTLGKTSSIAERFWLSSVIRREPVYQETFRHQRNDKSRYRETFCYSRADF